MLKQAERYTGYTAYDYLEAGRDYRSFRYAEQVHRVPEYAGLELSTAQAERAERLLAEETVISLHEHVQVFPQDMGDHRHLPLRRPHRPRRHPHLDAAGVHHPRRRPVGLAYQPDEG